MDNNLSDRLTCLVLNEEALTVKSYLNNNPNDITISDIMISTKLVTDKINELAEIHDMLIEIYPAV